MNYYIQGDAAKADKIKAAFEEKGYKTGDAAFNDKDLYYATFHGDVYIIATDCLCYEFFKRLVELGDYTELELPIEFKDGDIIGFNDCTHNDGSYIDWVGIYRHQSNDFINHQHFFHCVATSMNTFRIGGSWRVFTAYPATKEQRNLLFRKMKEAGYQWDAEKKELRKIKPHYNISNFNPFDKVLVRDGDLGLWKCDIFSDYYDNFYCFRGTWHQCIPFNDDTKHLLGTTDQCDEQYINW